ncbi:MAG: hypothetical protein HYR60_16535 [Acidobacteria bacterium]|nr:hypothetical protein [Acidobacteriota bacterium]
MDLAGQAKTLTVSGGSAWGLFWMPAANEIWFTKGPGAKRELRAVTLAGAQRIVLAQTGALTLEDISSSGRVLLNSTSQHMRMRFAGLANKTERDLSWLDWSLVSSISADGIAVAFMEGGEAAGGKLMSYYRKTDGSLAVKLGNVAWPSLSPDGNSVLAIDEAAGGAVILPIGPGETRRVPLPGFTINIVEWLPDARGFVFIGKEAGHGLRLYALALGDGKPRAISQEGVVSAYPVVSPDGKFATAVHSLGQVMLCPVKGGDALIGQGIQAGERPYAWSADGTVLYVMSRVTIPAQVYRVNWSTGRRELWKQVTPPDSAGVTGISGIRITPDGNSYAYSFRQTLSQLHLVEGLR